MADYNGTVTDYRGLLTAQGQLVPSQVQSAQQGGNMPVVSWLEYVSAEYARDAGRWVFCRDAYTGDLLRPQKMPRYLIRKVVGETAESFDERLRLSDYTPHFGAVVDSLVGMLFGAEVEANFDYGDLGDLDNPDTKMGQLKVNADGQGHGYKNLWRLVASDLTSIHKTWILVDPGPADKGRVVVRILPAESVTNERWVDGTLVEALVQEEVDARSSITQDPKPMLTWVLYNTEGWSRWRKNQEGEPQKIGQGTYTYTDKQGMAALPLFPVRIPLVRPVGYLMARKAVIIFNQESTRDHGLRFANFPLLNIFGNDITFKKVVTALKDGARALQNQPGMAAHAFIHPSGEPAKILSEVIDRKIEDFWRSSFREFSQSVGRGGGGGKTATESRYQSAVGVEAFLVLLKSAVDEAENETLWRLEQTYFPDDRSKWFKAMVERSDDFVPFDVNQMVERLRTRYFGQTGIVPVGREGRIAAAQQIADWDGLDTNPADLANAVDTQAILEAMQVVQVLYPGLTPEAIADMTMRVLATVGYVDPNKDSADPQTTAVKIRVDLIAQARKAQELQMKPKVPTGPSAANPKNSASHEGSQQTPPGGGASAAPGTPNDAGKPLMG